MALFFVCDDCGAQVRMLQCLNTSRHLIKRKFSPCFILIAAQKASQECQAHQDAIGHLAFSASELRRWVLRIWCSVAHNLSLLLLSSPKSLCEVDPEYTQLLNPSPVEILGANMEEGRSWRHQWTLLISFMPTSDSRMFCSQAQFGLTGACSKCNTRA